MSITNTRENKRREYLFGSASSYQGSLAGDSDLDANEKREAQNTVWGFDGMTEDEIGALGDRVRPTGLENLPRADATSHFSTPGSVPLLCFHREDAELTFDTQGTSRNGTTQL